MMIDKENMNKAPGGWIRVEDSQPDVGTMVLAIEKRGDNRFHVMAVREENDTPQPLWFIPEEWECYTDEVTHWMPLPALPDEEDGTKVKVYRGSGLWKFTKDTMPDSGQHVLACCAFKSDINGKTYRYICEAKWVAARTESDFCPELAEAYEYDEDEDTYWLPEGWYEVVHNADDYGLLDIDDDVVLWRPMPELPFGLKEEE